ncbi:MAG TPA: YfiR family protein [Verrucomicrobiae bacterium]|nr:YfiR family protein [Verrucomicrobiae bacterium]
MNVIFKWHWWLAAVLAAQLLRGGGVLAQNGGYSEYQVKAAFLYNFGKFVEWPANDFASTNSPLVIGIYGDNPFGNDLDAVVRGRNINGHPVVTREVTLNELKSCQILFIARSKQKSINEILRALDGAGVLTVTENMDPTEPGVMINFVLQSDRIRFEINNTEAEKVGLKLSSKLLMLAIKTTMLRKSDSPFSFLCMRYP